MPYFVAMRDGKHCVFKGMAGKPEGKPLGCHDSAAKARAQQRALYASERNSPPKKKSMKADAVVVQPTPDDSPTYAYVRFFFREGERTADSRVIDPGAINFDRQPPLPILAQFARNEGHAGAVIAGVVTKVARDGHVIVGDGFLDLKTEAGAEAFRLASPGPEGQPPVMQTWSPDLGDVVMEVEENAEDEDGTHPHDTLLHIKGGSLIGFTIVAIPALSSAVFEITDEQGNVLVPAPKREPDTGSPIPDDVQAASGGVVQNTNIQLLGESGPELFIPKYSGVVLRAHAAAIHPPAAHFEQVHFDNPERFVNLDEETGRVWGHAAIKGECHIGYLDRCVTIDMIADCRGEGSYEYAMPGQMLTAEGELVNVGPIAIKGGHADKGLTASQAMAHYDDPASTVAYVRYYNDEHGVSYSGVIAPMATPEMVQTLRASGVSLDARQIDGELRYLATCCVNTQGFPKVSARLAASALGEEPQILTLVAAGGPPEAYCPECQDKEAEMDALTDRLLASMEASISSLSPTP